MRLLEGEKCYLRALEPTDIDFLYKLENDEKLWEAGLTQKPFSRDILQQYLQNATQSIYQAQQLRLAIIYEQHCIGYADLYEFSPKHRRAGVGIVISSQYQGKGLATEALSLLSKYAFAYLDLHQLYAEISQDNLQSIRLFERVGFLCTGVKKDWIFWKGKYKDVGVYQLFSESNI